MRPFLLVLALLAARPGAADEIAASTGPARLPELWENPLVDVSSSAAVSGPGSPQTGDAQPAADKTGQDLMETIEKLKGKVPDSLYLQMEAQAGRVLEEMAAHPDAPINDVLKTVTGMDFDKMDRRIAELKRKNPKITDDELARIVASELIQSLPKPKPAP